MTAVAAHHDHHDDHHHAPHGLKRWLFSTNHKDIGTLYLWFSFAMFMVGGLMALVIRAELMYPGMQVVDPEFFNQMTTVHGLIMVFGAVMPATVGLANWMIPLMIGAPDMALPRMNNWSFWILPFAFTILIGSVLMSMLSVKATRRRRTSAGPSTRRCRPPMARHPPTCSFCRYT
jgi:cytochrome c oxidase subunit I